MAGKTSGRIDWIQVIRIFIYAFAIIGFVALMIFLFFPWTIADIPVWSGVEQFAPRISAGFSNGTLTVTGNGFPPEAPVTVRAIDIVPIETATIVSNSSGSISLAETVNASQFAVQAATNGFFTSVRSNIVRVGQ